MDEQGGGTEKTKKKVIGVAHDHGMNEMIVNYHSQTHPPSAPTH